MYNLLTVVILVREGKSKNSLKSDMNGFYFPLPWKTFINV